MNLEQFLSARRLSPDGVGIRAALDVRRRTLDAELAKTSRLIERLKAVTAAFDGLRTCTSPVAFGSTRRSCWMFVTRYSLPQAKDSTLPILTEIECVIVPEAVSDQNRHRSRPHADPVQAVRGIVTMSAVPVSGREIAEEAAASYASGVRIGEYEDVPFESCRVCNERAVVVCEDDHDYEYRCRWIAVRRLCTHCPLLEDLALGSIDDGVPSPILPLASPPPRP